MPRTASAPRFLGDGQIVFAEREYPDPGPGQLLLAVEANAICGTDREQYYEGSECVPGHEAAGVVIASGAGTRTPPGTRGAVFLMDYCGVCRSCQAGHTEDVGRPPLQEVGQVERLGFAGGVAARAPLPPG